MPSIETPQTAAASLTEMGDSVNNPAENQNDAVVNLVLKFEGVTFTPSALYTALDNAYGTVACEKGANGNTRGTYIFKITT